LKIWIWITGYKLLDISGLFSYNILMKSFKKNIEQMIRSLPDNSSVEDIQYHLYVLDKIQKGQKAIRDGKGITHEEAKARLSKWITN